MFGLKSYLRATAMGIGVWVSGQSEVIIIRERLKHWAEGVR